jgi:hypothetical protein
MNMKKMNIKNENPIKKQWSLKKQKVGLKGWEPSQHKHIPSLTLRLDSKG